MVFSSVFDKDDVELDRKLLRGPDKTGLYISVTLMMMDIIILIIKRSRADDQTKVNSHVNLREQIVKKLDFAHSPCSVYKS